MACPLKTNNSCSLGELRQLELKMARTPLLYLNSKEKELNMLDVQPKHQNKCWHCTFSQTREKTMLKLYI